MSSGVPMGGMFVCRPKPVVYTTNSATQGFTLMSDTHIGARNVDVGMIQDELADAARNGDRILINGDVFDLILVQDMKRFRADVLHPRLLGRADLVDAAIDWGAEIFGPFADRIDMIGVGNHEECFDAQTEVLTDEGWCPFPSLTSEHKVASYKVESGNIEFSEPKRIHKYYHNGYLLSIDNAHVDLLVTPNHRILYKPTRCKITDRRKSGTGTISKTKNGWRASRRVNGKCICGKVRYNLADVERDLVLMNVDSSREYLSNGWRLERADAVPRIEKVIPCNGLLDNDEMDGIIDDEIRMAAWLLTDGWLGKKGTVTICQRQSKSFMIRDLLSKLGWNYSEKIRDRNITKICGKKLKKKPESEVNFCLHDEGRKRIKELVLDKKRLPKWLWKCSKRQFDIFLESYVDGDGTRIRNSGDKTFMIYGRRHLLDDLQALCVIFGYRTSLVESRPNAWVLYTTSWTTSQTKSEFVKIPYSGFVYCVTTHNDTVVVRRNGKVSITGNSVARRHGTDAIKCLIRELRVRRKDKKHVIHYGGYCGFVDYRFRYATAQRPHGSRLVIFYHHGSGGSAPITKGMIDFSRLGWAEADVIWLGHKHNRLASVVHRLSCPLNGDEPSVKEVRHVMSGGYFDTYRGQSQRSVEDHGRVTNYAADRGFSPQGKGGLRLVVSISKNGIDSFKTKVIQ